MEKKKIVTKIIVLAMSVGMVLGVVAFSVSAILTFMHNPLSAVWENVARCSIIASILLLWVLSCIEAKKT